MTADFNKTGHLETGWFDASMPTFRRIPFTDDELEALRQEFTDDPKSAHPIREEDEV